MLPSSDACCESALEVDADADRDSTVLADSDELIETAKDCALWEIPDNNSDFNALVSAAPELIALTILLFEIESIWSCVRLGVFD
jgi:hypothetical protein